MKELKTIKDIDDINISDCYFFKNEYNEKIVTVISVYTDYVGDKLKAFVEVYSSDYGYTTLSHTEIR